MKRSTGLLVASGLLVAASPAVAQSAIRPGETVQGSLSSSDRLLDDGTFYDCIHLRAQTGQRINVTLRSDDFDAYLAVHKGANCASNDPVRANNDGAGGTDALVSITLGEGRYSIRANSVSEGETGRYTLTVEGLAAVPAP